MASKGPPSRKQKHFVTTDVWSPQTFCRYRDFVTSDVCHSLFFLSGCFFFRGDILSPNILALDVLSVNPTTTIQIVYYLFQFTYVKSPNFDFTPKVRHPLLKFLNHSLCISFSHIVRKGKMHLILFYIRKKIWGLH